MRMHTNNSLLSRFQNASIEPMNALPLIKDEEFEQTDNVLANDIIADDDGVFAQPLVADDAFDQKESMEPEANEEVVPDLMALNDAESGIDPMPIIVEEDGSDRMSIVEEGGDADRKLDDSTNTNNQLHEIENCSGSVDLETSDIPPPIKQSKLNVPKRRRRRKKKKEIAGKSVNDGSETLIIRRRSNRMKTKLDKLPQKSSHSKRKKNKQKAKVATFVCNRHEKPIPFGCKSTFRRHMKTFHSPNAPDYICDLCHKVFKRKDRLKEHLRSHKIKASGAARTNHSNATEEQKEEWLPCPHCGGKHPYANYRTRCQQDMLKKKRK